MPPPRLSRIVSSVHHATVAVIATEQMAGDDDDAMSVWPDVEKFHSLPSVRPLSVSPSVELLPDTQMRVGR